MISLAEIALEQDKLVLRLGKSEIAEDIEAQIFFTSVLNYEFDEENACYYQDKTLDVIELSRLVAETKSYIEEQGERCKVDGSLKKVLEAYSDSTTEYAEARIQGLKVLSGSAKKITIPGFVRQLKPYQVKPVMHLLAVKHAANFSVPGSGKTSTTYAAYAMIKKNSEVDKILVIGPRSSFMPWEEEYYHCFGRHPASLRISGLIHRDSILDEAMDNELILITYQMAANRTKELIQILQQYKTMLVLDESHYIKSFDGGIRASAVLKIAPYAAKRIILSGTPVPNSLEDLWTQMTFLWPHRNVLGTPLAFRQMIQRSDGLQEVRERISPFYCRISKHQLALPKQIFKRVYVPMGKYQSTIYRTLAAKTLSELPNAPDDRVQLHEWRRNKMIRLLQAASNPTLLNRYSEEFKIPPMSGRGLSVVSIMRRYPEFEMPSKIVKCIKITLDLLNNGHKVIIWSSFIHNIHMLRKSLEDRHPLIIYGDVPKDDEEKEEDNREKRIKEFKEDKKPRVLIANPSSCAESISLHKVCKHAIYLDRTFNAAHYMQSLDRIHRIGLLPNEKVNYIILLSRNTIDDVIDRRLQLKHRRLLQVLDDDLGILNLDSSIKDLTTEKELDADFDSVRDHLLAIKKNVR